MHIQFFHIQLLNSLSSFLANYGHLWISKTRFQSRWMLFHYFIVRAAFHWVW